MTANPITPMGHLMHDENQRNRLLTDRLQLRWLTLDDVDLMLAVWNDPAFIRHVGDRGIRGGDSRGGTTDDRLGCAATAACHEIEILRQ